MSSAPLIQAKHVSKHFAMTQALSDVSFSVMSGEVVALLGENGAGKSTLVKILSGIVSADEGSVTYGDAGSTGSTEQAAHSGVHLVHQDLALLPDRTVVGNIFLGSELRTRLGMLDWTRMREAGRAALAELGASEISMSSYVRDLPTGARQLVEIARALVSDAKVVILDEPTAALSPADAERLFRVIDTMKAKGAGVVFITHRLEEVHRIADRIVILKDSVHVNTSRASDMTIDQMVSFMVGRDVHDLYPDRPDASRSEVMLRVIGLTCPGHAEDVSFDVRRGEIVGIYGLEGHGQDEVLQCLAGDRRPTAGSLKINGRSTKWRSLRAMARSGIGYVPPDRKTEGLLLPLSGIENITIPVVREGVATGGFVTSQAQMEVARVPANSARIRGDLRRAVGFLSGGNQQKVLIARLLSMKSRVLLLNQPTRGVDIGAKSEIYALVREICSTQDACAVVVSREIGELTGLADRILVMSRGRLAGEHEPDATESEILATAVGVGGAQW